jgi:hypothetical protein
VGEATLAIPEDPDEARAVLRQNRVRTLDAVPRAKIPRMGSSTPWL